MSKNMINFELNYFLTTVKNSRNVSDLCRNLGLKVNTTSTRYIKKYVKENNIKLIFEKEKYEVEEIISHIQNSINAAEVMKKLGLKACGGNYSTINNYINKYKIDTSHWKRQAHNKNKQFKSFNNYKTKTAIKKHILRLRGAICESCKLEQCLNKPIKLELHHIDGNNQNNVEENLQLLCPNCHSFTDTWRKSYTR